MRLFVAINFSDEIKDVLDGLTKDLRNHSSGGNFTKRENFHLTLAFIGETDRCRDVKRIINTVEREKFDISLSGAGNFGDIQWVGLSRSAELEALSSEIKEKLISAGFDIDRKPFRPHVTLARKCIPDKGFKLTVPDIGMTCAKVCVMDSSRINGRLVYTEIFKKDLK